MTHFLVNKVMLEMRYSVSVVLHSAWNLRSPDLLVIPVFLCQMKALSVIVIQLLYFEVDLSNFLEVMDNVRDPC